MAFHKATREQAKLRLALAGLAGYGKTYSALMVSAILAELMRDQLGRRGRIAGIDTEHESMSLYAMTDEQREQYATLGGADAIAYVQKVRAFDFDTMPLDNHSPRAYVDAIREAEKAGYDIGIIDSLSHAWAGKNGALEQKDNIAARGGNSWTAWRDITPMHNALVDAMLASKMHLVATLRQKMEYIQTTEGGRTKIEKVGLASIQREGMEYEFTIFGDMEQGNQMRVSKHRLPGVLEIGDVFEKPGEPLARKLYGWLMSGAAKKERPAPIQVASAQETPSIDQRMTGTLDAIAKAATLADLEALVPTLMALGDGPVKAEARAQYGERKRRLQQELIERQKQPDPTASAGSSSVAAMMPSISGGSSDASTAGEAPAPEAA